MAGLWLGCGVQICLGVRFVRLPLLFEDLAMAPLDGRFPRLIDSLARARSWSSITGAVMG